MTLEDFTTLLTAMEQNAYELVDVDKRLFGDNSIQATRSIARWLALNEVLMVLTNKSYADSIWKIFIEDNKIEEDD